MKLNKQTKKQKQKQINKKTETSAKVTWIYNCSMMISRSLHLISIQKYELVMYSSYVCGVASSGFLLV